MRSMLVFLCLPLLAAGQLTLRWQNVDSLYGPLPPSVHVYFTAQSIDTSPFRAYYLVADLKDKNLQFTTDTTLNRRLTPTQFYERNKQPLVVVNGTFFSFETNRNLNLVMKGGKLLAYSPSTARQKRGDSMVELPAYRSAIGINKRGAADVVWVKTDSAKGKVWASQHPNPGVGNFLLQNKATGERRSLDKDVWQPWKVQTAIGGGPALIYRERIYITNEFEQMFTGKALFDKHPRTAMGYTADNKLIILVIEGRNKLAGGVTLTQEAQILKDLGCVEALNLDGGGSSCLLVNGKETIKPSDPTGQRAVPAVFMIIKN